ncbi:MAG TPA: hypothetical protein VF173_17885 [Thermoanaerobaculia bacterium]|nr:hypothetical protein [Thermoanaerobaculia bacterium]
MPWIKAKTVDDRPVNINPAEVVAVVERGNRSEVFLSSGAILDVAAKAKDLLDQIPEASPGPRAL